MDSIKVLYIMHVANNSGSVISLKNLIFELTQHGICPIVVYPERKSTNKDLLVEFKNMGATLVEGKIDQSAFYTDSNLIKRIYHNIQIPIGRIQAWNSLKRIIEKYKPDIIHTNSGISQVGFLLSRKYKIPHVWHIREYLTKDFNKKLYPSENRVRDLYGQSNTICITKDIQTYFGLSNNAKSHVIYNPIFSRNQVPENIKDKKNYFLIASRIGKEKGIDEIIESFLEANKVNPKFKLLIAGEGPEKDKYLKKYETYVSQGILVFLGFVKDVKPLMLEAQALLVGSRNEGFGRMTAEANMMGCCVIGRNSAGTKEILSSTKGGFLFDNKSELIDSIVRVSRMTSDELIDYMITPQKVAIQLYNNEKSAQEVLRVYRNIINN